MCWRPRYASSRPAACRCCFRSRTCASPTRSPIAPTSSKKGGSVFQGRWPSSPLARPRGPDRPAASSQTRGSSRFSRSSPSGRARYVLKGTAITANEGPGRGSASFRFTHLVGHCTPLSGHRHAVCLFCFTGRREVIKVQSLRSTIIVHLAAILLPLVALLVYQAAEDARRTANVEKHFRLHGLALEAKERYITFGNGAADAVDSSELSLQALAALRDARDRTAELALATGSAALGKAVAELDAMVKVLEEDRGLPCLLTLREQIIAQRAAITRTHADQETGLNDAIRQSIQDSRSERRWTAGVLLLALTVTVWFVFRMIRYLSRPLSLAVSVADRIAEGRPVAESELDVAFDVGNLVRSLGQMQI